MDKTAVKYNVKLYEHAVRDLDTIYDYIANTLLESGAAANTIEKIETAILSLDTMPQRCPVRKTGVYADKGYRQFFVGNYTIIFRIDEEQKLVFIITVRYSSSQF